MTNNNLFALAKTPILVAAAFVVIRIVLEFAGVTGVIPQIFGVAWLDYLVPIYLAIKIHDSGAVKPFLTTIKAMFVYAIPARLMVAISYMLAYAMEWSIPRFQNVIGANASAFRGFVEIPATGFAFGMATALVGAIVVGGATLLIKQRMGK